MFDIKNYAKSKIMVKLQASENYDAIHNESVTELIEKVNVDMSSTPSIDDQGLINISWVKFCTIINELISSKTEINLENFTMFFQQMQENVVPASREIASRHELIIEKTEEPIALEKMRELDADLIDLNDDEVFSLETEFKNLQVVNESDLSNEDLIEAIVTEPSFKNKKVIFVKEHEEIISPYTNTNYVAMIDNNTFLDIETEEEFKVVFIK